MVPLFISRLSLRALRQQVCTSSVLPGLQTFLVTEDAAKNQTNSAHCKPKECCQAPGTIRMAISLCWKALLPALDSRIGTEIAHWSFEDNSQSTQDVPALGNLTDSG